MWRSLAIAVDEWWLRWEGVLAGVTAVAIGLGLAGLLLAAADPQAAGGTLPAPVPPVPVSARPAIPVSAVPAPPEPAPAVPPGSLTVQPGGPVAAPVVDDVVHAFGSVAVGSTSAPLALEVTNRLAHPVEVRAVGTPDSPAFAIRDDTCTAAVLAPRTSCRVTVAFAPRAPGAARSSVAVSLREVCTSRAHWPCGTATPREAAASPGVVRSVLPSGRLAVDWTTELGDGWAALRVEGTTG